MIKTNILITGHRDVGKTTLVKQLVTEFQVSYTGFQTIPLETFKAGPTYQMQDFVTKKQIPISYYNGQTIVGIPASFATFGKACLEVALVSKEKLVVMDELGRFERTSTDFISLVNQLLSSEKIVIAVLKAESIDYLNLIKKRSDCYLYDLDKTSFNEVYQAVISKLKILLKRGER